MLLIFGTILLFMMTTNSFVIANVKQLRTDGSFRILLPFFRISWGVGVLNSAIFNSFQIGLSLARFWKAFGISGEGVEFPPPFPRYATVLGFCVAGVTNHYVLKVTPFRNARMCYPRRIPCYFRRH